MRAIVYTAAGGPEVIAIKEVPSPTAGQGQLRVRVRAAGLNRADIYQRRGGYPAPPGWPADIPGLEYAGEVESAGPGVTRWRSGDRVMGLVGGGAQAELLVVREAEALPIPRNLSFAEAAAIPEAFYTAYDALVTRGRLRAGERVLIHAIGSGVGTATAQIAKHLGATVIGTSRSAAKLSRAAAYGMDVGIDTGSTALREAGGGPINLIVDVIGGPGLADHLAMLAPRGRLVILGLMGGRRGEVEPGAGAAQAARDHRQRDAITGGRGACRAGRRAGPAPAAAVRAAGTGRPCSGRFSIARIRWSGSPRRTE